MGKLREGVSRLRFTVVPYGVPKGRWRQFVSDARRLLENGTIEAAAGASWTAHDLFGCDAAKPFERIDHMGLVWFVRGCRIVSL